ncbi:EamA-like transporter family protein [Flavobacterium croceum DSM 17960]|uniref:EamA-like transporter family protein n=1 Tax=Flavobacterium croceum DSM 17960 TaxID=1121886 RepID=A0A2S4NBM4_9FLAO|nr:DMT family transporter [Flavobacterium croceum]POS03030.1 EamA-like transporter family protein [Flavobacterium croceum DSM 17960]
MPTNKLKWILLIGLALVWGSSFILIFKGLHGLSAIELGSMRIIFSALFLWIIGFKSIYTIRLHQWKYIALTGFMGTFFPAYLFAIAETQVSSSIASILNSLTPLNTLLIGVLGFGFTFKRNQSLGILIGLLGILTLILGGNQAGSSKNIYYSLLVVLASICYAVNINLIKKYLSDVKPISITTGNFTVLSIPAFVILLFTDFFEKIQLQNTQTSLQYVLLLAVLGTGIANIVYFKLIQISSPIFASSVTYLIPIVACVWGFFNRESLTFIQYIGAFVILIGVYLSNKK